MGDSAAVDVVAIVVGLVVVVYALLDSFETLLATGIGGSRWSISRRYYRTVWWCWRRACLRQRNDRRRERWLARFGPLSFVGLLTTWAVLEIAGWGLVWWGLRHSFTMPLGGIGQAWYYSGVVYFSIGFGDLLPGAGALRMLTVLEAFTGLGTLGLVIGYLPSLYAAYSARERQLLLLDDLTDTRVTPVSVLSSYLGDGDAEDSRHLDAMFDQWAAWCAEVYDSHTSLPMLIWFRSKHRGHSWITGLGVVTDAAITYLACVPDTDRGPAMRLYRQSVRLVTDLATRVELDPKAHDEMPVRSWSVGYTIMQTTGFPMRSFDESFTRLRELRADFHPYMEAFIDELLAAPGFWGVTAADHLAEVDFSQVLDEAEGP